MVKKITKNDKKKEHSILDYSPKTSQVQVSNQSKSSHINNNKINTTKYKIDLNPKKTRKIRHFKTIKKAKPKKMNKINDLYNESIEFTNKSNNNNKSSSSSINLNNDFKIRIKENSSNEPIYKKYNFLFEDDNNLDNIDTKPDWMQEKTEKTMNSKLRYNYEILDYIDYITPKGWNKAKREIALDKLNQLVKSYNNNMSLILFGSSSQNTCTIFSDIDVTIIDDNKFNYSFLELDELNQIMYFLERNNYSYDMLLINAKVPIIRGTHASTGVKIDISYNRINGYEDSFFIKNILEENNIIRQAIMILKILLKENDLNEPYSGGMGSYLLFHLVYFFDIQCKNSKNMKYHNVFFFLFLFFDYFGTKFNFDTYGISLNKENPGKIFYKYGDYEMNDYENICIEGINERFVNIGRNCFNYEKVVELFKDAFHIIQNEQEKNTLSLLNELGFPSIKSELFNF